MPNNITRAANKITQRSGTYSGKGMLTAELLACFVIVFIRIVADFSVDETSGAVTTNVLHNADTYGPFPIALGLIGAFFVLSFLAAGGGTKAKLAVIFGGLITLALGIKSVSEIEKIATELADIGSITVPTASGIESSDLSGASNPNSDIQSILGSLGTNAAGTTGTTNPPPTPNTGTTTPPSPAGGPQNPNVFTQLPQVTNPNVYTQLPPGGQNNTQPQIPGNGTVPVIQPGPPLM